MNSNLHPIFQQALKPWTPPTELDAYLARIDAAIERIKALPYEQTPAYLRAMERQIQAQHVKGGV